MSFEGFNDVLYQPVTDDVAVVECDDPDTVDPFQHLHNGHQTRIAAPRQVDLRDVAGDDDLGAEAKAGIPGRFELQLGYTFQRSRYDEPEKWSDDVTPQRRMFRSPDHYGYLTANVNLTRDFTASVFGNYTGRMLVQHNAGYIERDTERLTPDFWDMGLRLSYNFRLTKQLRLELNAGVKNLFDSFQKDLDFGQNKDAAYIYGPAVPRTYFIGAKFAL